VSLLERVRDCAIYNAEHYRPFIVGAETVGEITSDVAQLLADRPDVFQVSDDAVRLNPMLGDFAACTSAVAQVLESLRQAGHVPGWRGEPYPVGTDYTAPALFEMERAAVPLFGVRGYGVHLNGYVERDDGLHMWIGRRSMTKPTGPGLLDQVVAGGLPAGISIHDNLIKECAEEAGMPPELARRAFPIGTIAYRTERPEGLRHDILFNYDIQLPEDFLPRNTDGEVDEFMLLPIEDVIETMASGRAYKFNAALVIIDFLVRRGLIAADDPDYVAIIRGLHMW